MMGKLRENDGKMMENLWKMMENLSKMMKFDGKMKGKCWDIMGNDGFLQMENQFFFGLACYQWK